MTCKFCKANVLELKEFKALKPEEKDKSIAKLWASIKEKQEKKEDDRLGTAVIQVLASDNKTVLNFNAVASVIDPQQVVNHSDPSHSECNGKGYITQLLKVTGRTDSKEEERQIAPCTCAQKNWLKCHPNTFQDMVLGMWLEIKEFSEGG